MGRNGWIGVEGEERRGEFLAVRVKLMFILKPCAYYTFRNGFYNILRGLRWVVLLYLVHCTRGLIQGKFLDESFSG